MTWRNRQTIAADHRTNEGGFVAVYVAVWMMALLTFAGLAIDVGAWYLSAAHLQRAVDAAATAGVTKLPDVAAARATTIEALAKNGYSSVTPSSVDIAPTASNRLRVTVHNVKVQTAFASWIVNHIQVTRSATAEYRKTLKLGNPYSEMGVGTHDSGQFPDIQSENYYLAINGYCTAAEDGDPYASRYDGNKGSNTGAFPSSCNGARGTLNPLYKPITSLDGGYNFIVDIPQGGPPEQIYLFDPAFNPGTGITSPDSNGHNSADISLAQPLDSPSVVDTSYRLFSSPGGVDGDFSSDQLLVNKTFGTELAGSAPDAQAFVPLSSTSLAAGVYRINVTTPDDGFGHSYGVNTFGIRVVPASGSFVLPGYSHVVCDQDLQPLCPQVYAIDALSIQTGTSNNAAHLDLVSMNSTFARTDFKVNLFDPGEGAQSMQLLRPDIGCMPFGWSVAATPDGGVAMSGTATSQDCSNPASGLDVSGTSPPLPGRQSNARFNDRDVVLDATVPTNYAQVIKTAHGNTWWSVAYQPQAGQNLPSDRTVWSVSIGNSAPVHLVGN